MTDDSTTPASDSGGSGASADREPLERPADGTDQPGGTGRHSTDAEGAPTPGRASRGRGSLADPEQAKRRRRRLVIGAIAGGTALIIVLGCLAAGALLRAGSRIVDRAEASEDRQARVEQACLELETRLNRLVPPGAVGGDPGRRAAAIRDEDAAVRPFLAELGQADDGWSDRRYEHRREWVAAWRMLVDARAAFADALDRQVTAGEPAFFTAPRERDGRSAVDRLERSGPANCAGPIRRLAHPDL